ncbi:MAG: hypothetical protein ACRDN9_18630 [Streptosporangiaceae bacterium]
MTSSQSAADLTPARWGPLRAPYPYSDCYGADRGTPVDRVFIDSFLTQHSGFVRGQVLEVATDCYALRYGAADIAVVDVVDIDAGNGSATLLADLTRHGSLPRDRYDCAVVTQTLQYVADLRAAVANLHDCLALGGALLVAVPGIARMDPGGGRPADRWRFTARGLHDLLADAFEPDSVVCAGHGDLHTATAFLYGLAAEDIGLAGGDMRTSDFPVVICGRARR